MAPGLCSSRSGNPDSFSGNDPRSSFIDRVPLRTQLPVTKGWMEHHCFCANSSGSLSLRVPSKAEIWQLDCHVRCPEYLGTALDVALASSCLVLATRATVKPGASR